MTRAQQVSPKSLVSYGVGTLLLVGGLTWVLAELATPVGVSVVTADLSGLGRTVGLIAAAAVGVPAAVLAYHRQRALDTANRTAAAQHETAARQHEHKVRVDDREHRTGTERHLRERYTTCAEQLGHDNSAIRLAGVYAIASLADDWHEFGNDSERQVCIDLLCAYLRSRPQPDEGNHVRTAIIRAIRSRADRGQWAGCQFDLAGADLTGSNLVGAELDGALLDSARLDSARLDRASLNRANLNRANLDSASLKTATLTGAQLMGANLTGANLFGADLTHAKLNGARLSNANLFGADLTAARLNGVRLSNANLTNANLTHANLTHARLTNARLTNARLTNADLTNADLTNADLTNADLTNADLTNANLENCRYSETTQWADGFTPPPLIASASNSE
ncbi:pentapeptide repeat-containing protein [Rhodococcus coprophilus]|nr:pentapeptide repeat-containing protein [Rhodococcus coprophilus]MBM7460532.1 uncharacterized protein YjbI with pentapeptide repeats [Rhodococcus coprophilus]